ncbi:kinesin-domain-containing protein [Rhizoclosmatium globosum]|uniref:Kinesin-like protein n=1 Tax=Rhizoclosmatium globosum TaxID=329046 RepID=A0A1Y2CAN7_9FUNG|nr:kinesin-domain-containing protein [Rhizoclosmatium globosum]|eukprot:ORY44103.1 kinesin-domain-containing protein [Rhizoclosmatium globosum]
MASAFPAVPPKSTVSSILVALRIRPLTTKESKESTIAVIKPISKTSLSVTDFSDAQDVLRQDRPREKTYDFDCVFSETASQVNVFEGTTKGLVDFVLQGFNTTVFAYGATGAGKTYTMLGTQENPGVMPLTLEHLFSQIGKSTRAQTTNGPNAVTQSFKVTLSYLEIYNENIRDLLSGRPDYLELWEDRLRGSVVAGIERVEAKTAADVLEWLEKGNLNRTQEATGANEASSRSHAVLQIFVAKRTCNKKGQYTEQSGKLSMIDLAGSERAADTKNRGMRMIEGASINRSLLALGNCINALTEEGSNGKYVNYRDSKLTRLLKDSLGGNCKTVMIANISPTSSNFEETLNTLKYASRARAIKNKVIQQAPIPIPKPLSLTSVASKSKLIAQKSAIELTTSSTSKPKKANNAPNNVLQRLSDSNLSKPHGIQSRYMGTANGPKPSTGVSSMLGELENFLLECFQERKSLQKSANAVNMKLTAAMDKIASARKAVKQLGQNSKLEEKIARYEQKAIKLRGVKKGMVKKVDELDEKVKSISQTFPRSLDSQSQKYLEARIKGHFIEMENLKLEGAQLILEAKLKKQESEYSSFLSQLSLLETITTVQRDMLDQKHVPIPEKLLEYYSKLKQAKTNVKPMSSGSDSSSGSDATTDLLLERQNGSNSEDLSSDESVRQERQLSRQMKAEIPAVKEPPKSGLLFPRLLGKRQSSTVGESCEVVSEPATSSFRLPTLPTQPKSLVSHSQTSVKSSTDTLINSQQTLNSTKIREINKSTNSSKPNPSKQADTGTLQPQAPTSFSNSSRAASGISYCTTDDSSDDSEFSTTDSPLKPRKPVVPVQKTIATTNFPSSVPQVVKTSTAAAVTKVTHESQAKTIREARSEIQQQIREARAERQRLKQSQDLEPKQGSIALKENTRSLQLKELSKPQSDVLPQRPISEQTKKVKVVAGKGIIA